MSARIVPFSPEHLTAVTEIFFESSTKKDFKDQEEKDRFFYKYLGFYLKTYPDLALVALEGDKVLGYVVGALRSHDLYDIQPHMKIFADEFPHYPSHLHINCHVESRGKGVGGDLVHALEEKLLTRNIKGLHIMTGVDAANKNFYRRLGFNHEVCKDFNGSAILLMGKTLRENRL